MTTKQTSKQMSSNGACPMNRRTFLGGAGALAGSAAALSAMPWSALEAKIEEMKADGWEARPVTCAACGGGCGLLAMVKKGTQPSPSTVRIYPNPTHPQRGMCGRSAQSMWMQDHPLRIRHPLKRIGERGEGKFQEVSWDEALNGIADKLREIVDKDGAHAVSLTSHSFSGQQQWMSWALGTPNQIGHQSTCNCASIAGKTLVFGGAFSSPAKIDPDYANARMLLIVGRSLNCSMGVAWRVAQARQDGCQVVFVDPRMPDAALGDARWVSILPGTDAAFMLSMVDVLINENLYDREFLAHHTNAAYLIDETGRPLTEKDFTGIETHRFAVKTADGVVYQGVRRNDKGAAVGFDENPATRYQLDWSGMLTLHGGRKIAARTCFNAYKELAHQFRPSEATKVTGVPERVIVDVARQFGRLKGVCDDGWYASKNGNDVEVQQAQSLLNAFVGNIDQKGGLIVTQGAGLKGAGVKFNAKTRMATSPAGKSWPIEDPVRLDKTIFPAAPGTFIACEKAICEGDPYPMRALFLTGTTMFHREANSTRLAKVLKALDLLVVQDLMPGEVCDYADYVLPATYFLETGGIKGIEWAKDGYLQKSAPGLNPPQGCEARDDVFVLLEVLRRAYPERAQRMGYDKELKTNQEFRQWMGQWGAPHFKALKEEAERAHPGDGERIERELNTQGWTFVKPKVYGQFPYQKPFDTPTGKVEIYSFWVFGNPNRAAIPPLPAYQPVQAYSKPAAENEFYMITGKNLAGSSGLAMFGDATRYTEKRAVWMNPADAQRLNLNDGDKVEIEALDTHIKATTPVHVTGRVRQGVIFACGFSGGVRSKLLNNPDYDWVREGVNPHWFATGYAQPVFGNLANNSSVRITRV